MDWILQLPSLQQVPLSERLALQAADIAATHRLRGADAVYIAVAEEFEMPLVTWDAELLDRAASIVNVIHP